MKQLKVMFLVAMTICISQVAFANTTSNPFTKEVNISEQIKTMLVNSNVAKFISEEVNLEVKFKVNANSEIQVLSTSDSTYDKLIKSILDNRKIETTKVLFYKTFIVPIKISIK